MRKLLILLALVPIWGQAQTNLIDDSTWTIGTGSASGFNRKSTDAENIREFGTGPHGNNVLLWKVAPTVSGGGWNDTDYVPMDHTKTYRLSVWAKKENSQDGVIYLAFFSKDDGTVNTGLNLNGTSNGAPYPFSGDLPTLNQWYLLVAYVHGSDYSSNTSIGGVYDTTGNKVDELTDYKFSLAAERISHRCYLAFDENTSDRAYFFGPAIYEVNGMEPTIQELISGTGNTDTQSPTSPTLSEMTHAETTVDLSWSGATDNVGVTGYQVYRDGVLHVSLGNQTLYQVKSLSPGTTYDFEVSAIDGQANESSRSNVVSVTTDSNLGGGEGTADPIWSESNGGASYNGNVAIGTTTIPNGYALAVDGKIISEEVKVQLSGNWPDYVFKEDYKLPTLEEIKKHIEEKGHLPNIPSAEQVKINGVDVGEMNRLLLEKVEELTLYILFQEEILNKQNNINSDLLERIEKLELISRAINK